MRLPERSRRGVNVTACGLASTRRARKRIDRKVAVHI
jgi:hypothetical protein